MLAVAPGVPAPVLESEGSVFLSPLLPSPSFSAFMAFLRSGFA